MPFFAYENFDNQSTSRASQSEHEHSNELQGGSEKSGEFGSRRQFAFSKHG